MSRSFAIRCSREAALPSYPGPGNAPGLQDWRYGLLCRFTGAPGCGRTHVRADMGSPQPGGWGLPVPW